MSVFLYKLVDEREIKTHTSSTFMPNNHFSPLFSFGFGSLTALESSSFSGSDRNDTKKAIECETCLKRVKKKKIEIIDKKFSCASREISIIYRVL